MKTEETQLRNSLPYEIYLTYKTRSVVPEYIFQQYEKFAKQYHINFFDDHDCMDYMSDFGKNNKELFNSIVDVYKSHPNGAHKADMWRYAVLYNNGGIYFDIKTMLVKNLVDIFDHTGKNWYTVISAEQHRFPEYNIHQGIIASPKNNAILKDALKLHIQTPVLDFQKYYWTGCNQLYSLCCEYYQSNLSQSRDKAKEHKLFKSPTIRLPDLFLMQERCSKKVAEYKSDQKRYGLHCVIENDIDCVVFNTRDTQYGHKW